MPIANLTGKNNHTFAGHYITPEVQLYTDGACNSLFKAGGWAFALVHPKKTLTRSDCEPDTTNNRMEMTAVLEGLKALKRPCAIEIISDSSYVLQGMCSWMVKWKRYGWRLPNGANVKNLDLW